MATRTAYSYLRYSSPQQEDGDSVRRQTETAQAWCRRHGLQLDTSNRFEERGTSAFRGKHRQAGAALALFLADVQAGRIAAGSVLVIENLDRLSRENPWDAVPLLCSIVNAGISVVTLSPSEFIYERGGDLTGLILAVVEFARGHSESKSKSHRLAESWGAKKQRARADRSIVTGRVPAWVRRDAGHLVPIPERVEVVKRIFEWTIAGYGLARIVGKLTADGVKTWGRGKAWSKAYVHKILTSRTVLGEYQPKTNGKPDGDPVPEYYPVVVPLPLFEKAQDRIVVRKNPRGRVGAKVANLFYGLLFEAGTGRKLRIAMQSYGKKGKRYGRRVLVSADSMEGIGPSLSFPAQIFEDGFLKLLEEVTVAEVVGDEPTPESAALKEERDAVRRRIKQMEDQVTEEDDIVALGGALKKLAARQKELEERYQEARRREASPLSEALEEAKSLLDVAVEEEQRLRLRDLLRQLVEEVRVLVVTRGSFRFAAIQAHFTSGTRRNYLIYYQSAGHGRQGTAGAGSTFASVSSNRKIDLRKPEDAAALADELHAWNFREDLPE